MGKIAQDFRHWKGNDKQISFFVEDVDNLIGFKARWALAETDSSPVILEKSSEGASPKIQFSEKEVIVTLAPADTAPLLPMKYYHQLTLWDNDNKVSVSAIGELDLRPVI